MEEYGFFRIKENKDFEFVDTSPTSATTLANVRPIVRQLLNLPTGRTTIATAAQLFLILGRLRSLSYSIHSYTDSLHANSPEFTAYWKPRLLNQLSGFGISVKAADSAVCIDGLNLLIEQIERIFANEMQTACETITNGKIVFDALAELYKPGILVMGNLSIGAPGVFRVTECYFDERRSLMGIERSFHLGLEFIASIGDYLAVVPFSETMSGWTGIRMRPLTELTYIPLTDPLLRNTLIQRGKMYIDFSIGGCKFVEYSAGSFFMHTRGSHGGNSAVSGGRIIIDGPRGASLGHFASQGSDEPTLALTNLTGRYKRAKSSSNSSDSSDMLLFSELPHTDWEILCWPALVGFSFSAKCWGHVLVSGLNRIAFRTDAFDRLVLAPERKQLIRALVRFGSAQDTDCSDLIAGKSGGSVFLLHGPPGVGKTLTAEAIAEVLQRPLYYVSMGELGTTPGEMEQRLSSILDLCANWNALVLLDEADVFLETRNSADLIRNAMVCVMLRLLEYHPGILFLTTNRVRSFDPAFESRVTVALRYDALSADARAQVWRNLLLRVNKAPDVSVEKLAANYEMNGRQIKNAVRLAVSLAREKNVESVTQDILETTLQITFVGRKGMKDDDTWH